MERHAPRRADQPARLEGGGDQEGGEAVILVDGITEHEAPALRYKRWSHLVSTKDEAELHAFAARLGLRRGWAQLRPAASAAHYDVTPPKRALAVRLGAREV